MHTKLQPISFLLILIFLAVVLSSCSQQKIHHPTLPASPLKITTVGIIPFTGNDGEYLANSLAVSLRKCGVTIFEGNKFSKIITESGYQINEVVNLPSSSLSQIGKKSGVHNILVGSVSSEVKQSSGYNNMRVSLRLIDSEKEKVVWTQHSQYWSKPSSKYGDTQRAAEQLANTFCNDFKKRNE